MSSISGTNSTSGGMALSGVYSGIDSETLVAKLMAVESAGLTLLQNNKAKADAKTAAMGELQKLVTSLQSAANALKDPARLRQVVASSTDNTILTAASTGGATAGVHNIVVNRLATSMREVHAGLASDTALVGEGKFVYTYNGQTRTVLTSATTTQADLVNLINSDSQNPGVRASLLNYRVDDTHQSHLVLSGAESGDDKTITITAETTLAAFAEGGANWAVTQTAQDSQFRIDGYPPAGWIERDGNTVTDAIPGVSLTLQKVGTAGVNLNRDNSTISNGLQGLVTAYNALADKVHSYTTYDAASKRRGPLQGDSNITSLLGQVRSQLTSILPGFDPTADAYDSAADIGLSIDKDGNLSLNTTTLNTALGANYNKVLNLISAAHTGASSSSYLQFNFAGTKARVGQYEVQVDYDGSGTITGGRIRLKGAVAWDTADIGSDGKSIVGKSGTSEEGLIVAASWDQVSATQSATVSLQDGFASSLYGVTKNLLDPTKGLIYTEQNAFKTSSEHIQKRIEDMNTRLAQKQQYYAEQFARMEDALAKFAAQKSQFEALFASLDAESNSKNS